MRILFLSAFYPPYVIGGWEQLVEDINREFQTRGHETHVLTSVYGVGKKWAKEPGVDRILTLESNIYHYKPMDFLAHSTRLKNNLRRTKAVIEKFKPDIVFIHGMWNLSKGIAWVAEQLCPERVVYYIANDWPYAVDMHSAFWKDRARRSLAALAKELIAPIPLEIIQRENHRFQLDFKKVLCVSHAIKDNLAENVRIDAQRLRVVYNGVEENLFIPDWKKIPYGQEREFSLLYAGSIAPHKGVHTAIEAMALLNNKPESLRISLSIVGSGLPDYEASLHDLVKKHHLEEKVHFLGRYPRAEMPNLLQKFDVLILPSIWEEPLSRVMEEAMAAGLTIVGTLTGGSGELLVEGETGLTFEPGNAEMLAQRIEDLYSEPGLCKQLAENGRNRVIRDFGLHRMMDEIEAYLDEVVKNTTAFKM